MLAVQKYTVRSDIFELCMLVIVQFDFDTLSVSDCAFHSVLIGSVPDEGKYRTSCILRDDILYCINGAVMDKD